MRIECLSEEASKIGGAQPLRVSVEANIASRLAQTEITITSDYYSAFRQYKVPSYNVNADEYLRGVDKSWDKKFLLCPEMPAPRRLCSAIRLVVQEPNVWSKQAVALIHVGRRGCVTPIHFDWDHTWVAHACVIGRKRFFLIPPTSGWLLSPIINTSALAIPRFSEADRFEILGRLGGIEITLEPGQGILFPSMFWHGALYEEPSLAVSLRFEMFPGGRPFTALPRSWLLQRLLWTFFNNGYTHSTDFLRRYLKSFFTNTKRWMDRYRRTTKLCREFLMCQGQQQGVAEWIGENFSSEIALAARELKLCYDYIPARDTQENDHISETRSFLFDGIKGISAAQQLRLAHYALSVRQGLPPKRGLVQIEQE